MSDLLAARSQMAMSLGFHIIFAVVGIGMPVLMVVAEHRWHRTRDPVYLALAQRWARGTAILFAVGAVSGTVLSFELGLLWPAFMRETGAAIGLLFSLEGFAFFAEAIFLGVYLYGWDRVSARAHLAAGVLVAVSGSASALFVVSVNAWMNTPVGFRVQNGHLTDIDPIRAMQTPAAPPQVLHMVLAAFAATGLAVAAIHAFLLLRSPANRFHRLALAVALTVGGPAAVLQPISGDISAHSVAHRQPVKLAALEADFTTQRGAPLRIWGRPDEARARTVGAITIPRALSLLAYHDPDALVQGLDAFPRDRWPPVALVHLSFDLMVALGLYMAVVSLWALIVLARHGDVASHRLLLRTLVAAGPMGFIAIEAGWVVTEVGRQPWIVYGVFRTADAVTPMPGLIVPFVVFTALYCFLGIVVGWLLYRQLVASPSTDDPSGLHQPKPLSDSAPQLAR
jgi:cytochrome bd ubiquinol oxidase subunit I